MALEKVTMNDLMAVIMGIKHDLSNRIERMERIMGRMEGRMKGTERSLCKELDNLVDHPSLPNQVPMSGQAPHKLQGNQTNSCTLVNEAHSQLSVNDSLSLGEPNIPSSCRDSVQLEIVYKLVDPLSVEDIVLSDSTLSYESHED